MASLASPVVADLDTRIVRTHARPAMPKTPGVKSLYKSAAAAAARQRITLADEARLGASDANLLVAAGLPTIDGLGPVGENDHSVQERILSESLYERVELLVRLLWDLKNWRPERRPIRPRLRRS
jgi:glutamate carboxypeptidase